MAASKMTDKRLNALRAAVAEAGLVWDRVVDKASAAGFPALAAEFTERKAQAETALEVIEGRFQR